MEQVIIGGYYDLLNTSANEYNSLFSGRSWLSTEFWAKGIISTDGVIKNLRVKLDGTPGAGKSYAFTLMVDGAPTALTLTISDAETSGSDANEVNVSVGQTVSLRCVPSGNPTGRYATWTIMFEGVTAKQSIIMASTYSAALSKTSIKYRQVMGADGGSSGVEDTVRQVCPTAGTIKNLYVELSSDPGTIGVDAYRFTVRLNGATVAESLIVTITANDKTGNDTSHNLAVVAGDVLTFMIEPLNAPSSAPRACFGMTFEADVDGESIIMAGSWNPLDQTTMEYLYLYTSLTRAWIATEAERYNLGQVCTLKKLYMLLSGSPGAGNKYDFTVRIAGAGSNVVAIVSGTDTTGNSGALEDTVADDEYVGLQVVPDSTPTARNAYWGLVSYIAPVVGWAGGDVLGVDIGTVSKINGVALADIVRVNSVS